VGPQAKEGTRIGHEGIQRAVVALLLGTVGASLGMLAFGAGWRPVLAGVLSELRATAAIAASGLILALAALGFVAVTGPRRRPVALLFAAAVALGALTVLSQLSWLGERF